MRSEKSGRSRYLFSIVLSICGISLHFFLAPNLTLIPFILAFPIIFVTTTQWGFGPALVGTILWSYSLSYYHFEPLHSLRVSDPIQLLHLLLFFVTSTGVSWMVEQSRIKDARQNALQAENLLRNRELAYENKLKDEFVNTLSHDLKNPLSVALTCLEMIERNASDPERTKMLSMKATGSLRRIDRMILDLLDSRRISAGNPLNMEMEKFDLALLLKKIRDDFTTLYGHRFTIQAPESFDFIGSERYIRRAIENLLTNAIKYGDENRTIDFGITVEDERIDVWVRNWGKILNSEERERIFKLFSRLNPQDTTKEGWGIGLSLVKAIVEGHKGDLSVTSNESDGTRFHLLLPSQRIR